MAINWVSGFIIPILETTIILGVVGFFILMFYRGFKKTWRTQTKWFLRYKILRKPYPEKAVEWVLNNIEHGVGYYETKKMLLIKGINDEKINGIMWVYDEILKTMKDKKELKKNYSQIEKVNYPELKGG